MAGIIILDEDMQPECQYSNVGLDYDAWKELIQDKKISEITKYSKKIYAERIQKNENGMIWQQYPEQTVRELYFATVIRIQTV